jgi:GNAT superfamily N-acetyltransferase
MVACTLPGAAEFEIREAVPADAAAIFSLVRDLAAYERLLDEVTGSEDGLARWLFGPARACEALVAVGDGAGSVIGFALYYRTFSTFDAAPGLWLEDLFVVPSARRLGVGRALLARLASLTVERGYTRLEWAALDWNEPALSFYATLGAEVLTSWKVLRLSGPELNALGS